MGTISLTLPVSGTVITAGLHSTNYTTIQNVVNGNIDNNNFGAGKIFDNTKIMQGGATTGQFMKWDGTNWVPATLPATGISVYDRVTTAVDVNTSVTETSIYTKSITGNDMSTNKMLRLSAIGDYLHNNAAGDTLTLRVKFGGTTFYAYAGLLGNVTGAARHPWVLDLRVANLGATNSQMIAGSVITESADTGAATTGIGQWAVTDAFGQKMSAAPLGISTLGTIDTTANQTLDVTVQWSASSANNSWRMRYAVLELA